MNLRAFLLFIVTTFLINSAAQAEFLCRSDIHYKWVRDKKVEIAKKEEAEAKKGEEGVEEVLISIIESKGSTQEEAKAKLQELISKETLQLQGICKDEHENQTRCLASKYSLHSAAMHTMSFGQRKEFEKKMSDDCQSAAGKCVGISSNEPVCSEVVGTEGAGGADAKGKDAKKDAKKK